jgi:hypothetical protein
MTSFIAIYRGKTVAEARLIAVSANPDLVAEVSSKLLEEVANEGDEILEALSKGRRFALTLVKQEAKERK